MIIFWKNLEKADAMCLMDYAILILAQTQVSSPRMNGG